MVTLRSDAAHFFPDVDIHYAGYVSGVVSHETELTESRPLESGVLCPATQEGMAFFISCQVRMDQ
jgi:hypothetical protein